MNPNSQSVQYKAAERGSPDRLIFGLQTDNGNAQSNNLGSNRHSPSSLSSLVYSFTACSGALTYN